MKDVTKSMIKNFKLCKYGFDFAGYDFTYKNELSFHHLLVPKGLSKRYGIPSNGYIKENGAILVQETSHNYLHLIQSLDEELFYRITSEMVDENVKDKLDIDNLKRIRGYLEYFESEHDHDRDRKGNLLIKRKYVEKRHNFD